MKKTQPLTAIAAVTAVMLMLTSCGGLSGKKAEKYMKLVGAKDEIKETVYEKKVTEAATDTADSEGATEDEPPAESDKKSEDKKSEINLLGKWTAEVDFTAALEDEAEAYRENYPTEKPIALDLSEIPNVKVYLEFSEKKFTAELFGKTESDAFYNACTDAISEFIMKLLETHFAEQGTSVETVIEKEGFSSVDEFERHVRDTAYTALTDGSFSFDECRFSAEYEIKDDILYIGNQKVNFNINDGTLTIDLSFIGREGLNTVEFTKEK